MKIEERIYEAIKKLEWLIDGYHVNCILPFTKGKFFISTEWIVKHYNVDISYFKPKYFES